MFDYTLSPVSKTNSSFPACLITGVARSGTTILGRLIGSFHSVEYEYEPWLLAQVPALITLKQLPKQAGAEIINGFLYELFVSRVLGRNVNVRESDDSAVPVALLRPRWKIKDRGEALEFAKKNKSMLVFKMVNLLSFTDFFAELPMKMIHIIRNPWDTALSISKKEWFLDKSLSYDRSLSPKVRVRHSGKAVNLPWWLKRKDMRQFIRAGGLERALICWRTQFEEYQSRKIKSKTKILEIRYEDLISRPASIATEVSRFLNTAQSAETKKIIKKIDSGKAFTGVKHEFRKISVNELRRVNQLAEKMGYAAIDLH